jgi:CheY-like chemotaxis protein
MSKPLSSILYVEDEADIRTVGTLALRAVGGFHVLPCASGHEAIEAARATCVDLIVLDVMMPGMDGPTTFKELREIPAMADTPVIFMTAKVQSAEIAQYRALGAIDVIPKPFDPMQVSEEIRRIWEARQL